MNPKPMLAAVLVALTLTGCASQDWTRGDTAREILFQATNAIDAYQTAQIRHRPDLQEGHIVTAAIIGEQPSESDVALYFGTVAVSHFAISRILPPKWRRWFQVGTLGYSAYTVDNNCERGLSCPW